MQTTCRLNCWWRQQVQKNQWFAGGLNINAWDHWAVSPTKKEPGDQPHPTTDPRLVCCSVWWPSERYKATPVLVRSSSQHVPDSRNQNAHVVNGFDWLRWLPSGCGLGWQPVPASHWWVRGHKLRVPVSFLQQSQLASGMPVSFTRQSIWHRLCILVSPFWLLPIRAKGRQNDGACLSACMLHFTGESRSLNAKRTWIGSCIGGNIWHIIDIRR